MFDKLERVVLNFLGYSLIFLVILTSAQVVMRYVFNSPLTWAEEFIGVVMIYFGLIGGSWGIRHGIHIALEVFVERFMRFLKPFVVWLEVSVYIFMGILEVVYGIKIMDLTRYQVLPATGIKVSYTYAALPIAGALMLFFSIELVMKRRDRS